MGNNCCAELREKADAPEKDTTMDDKFNKFQKKKTKSNKSQKQVDLELKIQSVMLPAGGFKKLYSPQSVKLSWQLGPTIFCESKPAILDNVTGEAFFDDTFKV